MQEIWTVAAENLVGIYTTRLKNFEQGKTEPPLKEERGLLLLFQVRSKGRGARCRRLPDRPFGVHATTEYGVLRNQSNRPPCLEFKQETPGRIAVKGPLSTDEVPRLSQAFPVVCGGLHFAALAQVLSGKRFLALPWLQLLQSTCSRVGVLTINLARTLPAAATDRLLFTGGPVLAFLLVDLVPCPPFFFCSTACLFEAPSWT